MHGLGYKNYGIASAFFFGNRWLKNFGNKFDYFVNLQMANSRLSK
jgi:hypothetical protein